MNNSSCLLKLKDDCMGKDSQYIDPMTLSKLFFASSAKNRIGYSTIISKRNRSGRSPLRSRFGRICAIIQEACFYVQ